MGSNFIDTMLGHALYVGLTLSLVLCGMGLPLPEEAIFIAAGCLGIKYGADIWWLCVAGLIGIMLGDSIPFFVGRRYGMTFLTRSWVAKLVKPHHIEKTKRFFEKRGAKAVFIARFLAGLRMPTFFMAGAMGVSFLTFFLWDFAGALVSCPTSIFLVFRYGKSFAEEVLHYGHIVIFVVIGLIAAFILYRWMRSRGGPPPPPPLPADTPVIVSASASSATTEQQGEVQTAAKERPKVKG